MEDVENTRKPEEVELSGKSYYLDVSLEEAETNIHACLRDAARNVIATGHYLKVIRDKELYREAGYENIWDYAAERFGFSKSTASRYMARSDKFSVGGNSPVLAEEFREYSKAQLQEILSLDAEQMSAVTPDMTVREIRELRKPKELPYYEIPGQLDISDFPGIEDAEKTENASAATENSVPTGTTASAMTFTVSAEDLIGETEEKLSAYGFPKRVYPADSLLTTPGCKGDDGRGYDCFSCHLECRIRQDYCHCVDATCGSPFPCQMIDTGKHEILEKQIGDRCQFIDLNLADHAAGDGSAMPCCKKCETPCEYACENSGKCVATSQQMNVANEQQETEENAAEKQQKVNADGQQEKENTVERTDLELLREMLERKRQLLGKCMAVPGVDESDEHIRKQKLEVSAVTSMICGLEKLGSPEEMDDEAQVAEKPNQPELPLLKNNEQRAKFIDSYEAWPLWIDNRETGERYYRYDLPDGTSFVIKTYHAMLYDYDAPGYGNYKEGYGESEQYLLKPGKFFRDCWTSRSTLIDKLKELQRAGN